MHRHESLRVDLQPVLGSAGPISVQYQHTPPTVTEIPIATDVRPRVAPFAAPEILDRLDALVHGHDADNAVLHRIANELMDLRADLQSRTFAARCRRAWAWLKGRFDGA